MICDLCDMPIHCDLKGIIKYGEKYLHRDCIVPKNEGEKQLDRIERMLRYLIIARWRDFGDSAKLPDISYILDEKE